MNEWYRSSCESNIAAWKAEIRRCDAYPFLRAFAQKMLAYWEGELANA